MTLTDDKIRRAALLRERSHAIAIEGDPTEPGYGCHFTATYFRATSCTLPRGSWSRQRIGTATSTESYSARSVSGAREVFLAPRGFAKSTKTSLVTPLICLARQFK